MQIPRSYVDRYSKALNAVSARAKEQLEAALSQIDYTADVATVREAVSSVMRIYCGASSTLAAKLAAEFYDGLRTQFGIEDGFEADPDPMWDPDATDGAVRAFVQPLVDGNGQESVISLCMSRAGYEVNRTANECVARNARKDPRKPKWARVPTGSETCHFCLMLASRGFGYFSESAASHSHDNCDCRAVPSWDVENPMLEGYDSDKLKGDWNDAVDGIARERSERNGTSFDDERSKIFSQYEEASRRAKERKKGKR